MNYETYYNIEEYLFNGVNKSFHRKGYLTSEEFFCIVIWKANRAKSKIARKFISFTSIDLGIKELTEKIFKEKSRKEKLKILLNDYGFYLPMASAILSVLYPEDFSVYDIRVCEILDANLESPYYSKIVKWKFDNLWIGYENYLDAKLIASGKETYRESDKYLWGKSFYEQLILDLKNKFSPLN